MNKPDHLLPDGSLVGLYHDPNSQPTIIYDENKTKAISPNKL